MPTPGSIVAIGSRHGKIAADAEGREGSSVQIVPPTKAVVGEGGTEYGLG